MARDQPGLVQIGPDRGEVFALDAQKVDPLAAGDVDGGDVVFLGRIGNRAQLVRGGHPAPHPRHDAEGAVLLDVRVLAFVDEAALRVVLIFKGPVGEQVEVERRTADMAAAGGLPAEFLVNGGHGLEFLALDQAADLFVGEVGAAAHPRLFAFELIAQRDGQDLFDEAGAGPAGGAGLGRGAECAEIGRPASDGVNDGALANAVTATDFRIKR